MLVTFLIAVTNLADSLKKRGVIVPYGSNGHRVSHRSGMAAGAEGVGHIASSQEESNECLLSAPFSLFQSAQDASSWNSTTHS